MSTENIVSVEPVLAGIVPIGVNVTFAVHGGTGYRTYFYNAPEAITGILNGEDPARWDGVRVG